MRVRAGFLLLALVASACGGNKSSSLPENPLSLLGYCGVAPREIQAAGFENEADLDQFLQENHVTSVNAIAHQYLVQFAFELKRFPETLLSALAAKGANFRILQGHGVTEDPTWPASETTTFDGRPWNRVPGAGGNPTRVVVNRLYQGHGSINLVLHEHGHTLDFYGVPRNDVLSSSPEWKNVMARDRGFMKLMNEVCGGYCTRNPTEAFAEAFAIYYSCEKGRGLLSNSPLAKSFIESLENFKQ